MNINSNVVLWSLQVLAHQVLLVSPDRGITYPSAEYVKDVIARACEGAEEGLLVVVDGRAIKYIDSTALKVFCATSQFCGA